MSEPLYSYLRTYRKHSGLTQVQVAYLLEHQSADKISRYERGVRKPDLIDAFALQVIFDVPANEMFRGLYHEIEITTQNRAYLLTKKVELNLPTPIVDRKIRFLRSIYQRALD
ncbi:MAG: helix-turn-helix transcriptional regulator [Alphaproteobacteria bacterium]